MRPFRNPRTPDEIAVNQNYLDVQGALIEQDRNRDWVFPADTNLADWVDWDRNPIDDMIRLERNRLGGARARRVDLELDNNPKLMKQFPALNFDKIAPGNIVRDFNVPPFKVDYDSHEQINAKLNNTVILIKDRPFYVRNTFDLGKRQFGLLVDGPEDMPGSFTVSYNDVKDCRSVAPGYYMHRGVAYWVYRIPERQNSQGMSARNMAAKTAGQKHAGNASHNFLRQALASVKDVPFAENLQDVLLSSGGSLRLNHNIALYLTNKKGAPVGIEYCGRQLGLIVNGAVKVMDENDLRPSWIHKDLAKVGLVMGV